MDYFSQPIDQGALTLTRSIALAETGKNGKPDYNNRTGDNGTSKGAYQWQPGNYENAAKKYGLDPYDFSPTNQDKVAYAQVKEYKEQGLQPWEIAAMWNSGNKKNYENHSGDTVINGKTIHYDTPAYVNRVKGYYSQLSGSQSPVDGTQSDPTATPSVNDPSATTPNTGTADGTTQPHDSIGRKILNGAASIVGGKQLAQGLGQTIANTFSSDGNGVQQGSIDAQNQGISIATKLEQLIKEKKSTGQDTSRLETALSHLNEDLQSEASQTTDLGTQGITNKGVIGSSLQLGANLIPGSIAGKNASLLAKVGEGAAVGYINDVGAHLKESTDTNLALKDFTPGIGTVIGASIPLVIAGVSKALEGVGKKIQMSTIRPLKADLQDGFKIENVNKYDLGGSLGDTLQKSNDKMDSLSTELKTILSESNETADINRAFERTKEALTGNKLKTFGSNSAIDKTLEQLQSEITTVAPNGYLSLPNAQQVKQGAGAAGAWVYGVKDAEATAREKVYTEFYKHIKTEIDASMPVQGEFINQAISEIIPIRNAALRRIPVEARNNALGITDMISLVSSIAHPGALALGAVGRLQKSGVAGNALVKASTGITGSGARRAAEILLTKAGNI